MLKMKGWVPVLLIAVWAGCERGPEITDTHGDVVFEDEAESGARGEGRSLDPETEMQVRSAELTVAEAVAGFRTFNDRYPGSLAELMTGGQLATLPDLPDGFVYEYDSSEGAVTVVEEEE